MYSVDWLPTSYEVHRHNPLEEHRCPLCKTVKERTPKSFIALIPRALPSKSTSSVSHSTTSITPARPRNQSESSPHRASSSVFKTWAFTPPSHATIQHPEPPPINSRLDGSTSSVGASPPQSSTIKRSPSETTSKTTNTDQADMGQETDT